MSELRKQHEASEAVIEVWQYEEIAALRRDGCNCAFTDDPDGGIVIYRQTCSAHDSLRWEAVYNRARLLFLPLGVGPEEALRLAQEFGP